MNFLANFDGNDNYWPSLSSFFSNFSNLFFCEKKNRMFWQQHTKRERERESERKKIRSNHNSFEFRFDGRRKILFGKNFILLRLIIFLVTKIK